MLCINIMEMGYQCLEDIIKYWNGCKHVAALSALILVGIKIFYIMISRLAGRKERKKTKLRTKIYSLVLLYVFGIYAVYLAYVTLGMRYVGQRQEVNLIPFSSFQIHSNEFRFIIENILLFIPFGVLGPMLIQFLRKKSGIFFAALTVSVSIELIQYFFKCGKTETDDVICNVFGACIGFIIYKVSTKRVGKG